MASFDVNSLFTNVPPTECVNFCWDFFKDFDFMAYNEFKFTHERKLPDYAVQDNHFISSK